HRALGRSSFRADPLRTARAQVDVHVLGSGRLGEEGRSAVDDRQWPREVGPGHPCPDDRLRECAYRAPNDSGAHASTSVGAADALTSTEIVDLRRQHGTSPGTPTKPVDLFRLTRRGTAVYPHLSGIETPGSDHEPETTVREAPAAPRLPARPGR